MLGIGRNKTGKQDLLLIALNFKFSSGRGRYCKKSNEKGVRLIFICFFKMTQPLRVLL
jgi:hypothetical protein